MTYGALDLFSGIGTGIALSQMGRTELGVDNDPRVRAIRHHHGLHTLGINLWTTRPADVELGGFDGIHGSPSCRKWSVAGLKEATSELSQVIAAIPRVAGGQPLNKVLADMDPEAALVLSPLEWVAHHRPAWVTMEQVTSVQPVWDAVAVALEGIGYHVDTAKVHMEQHGLPQTRYRSILVANRTVAVELPRPTHSRYYPRNPERLDSGVKPWVSMADALGWGASERPGMTVTGGGTYTGGAEPFGTGARRGLERERDAGRWVERPDWPYLRPSTTIVGSFRPDIVAAPGWRKAGDGPRQNTKGSVRVTLEEAAKLQGFPDDMDWSVLSSTAGFRVCGNAVPPLYAEKMFKAAMGQTP